MSLEMRPDCEHCGVLLLADSAVAMICSFECTFCRECAAGPLNAVCPNCGGGFSVRPTRIGLALAKHPASNVRRYPATEQQRDRG